MDIEQKQILYKSKTCFQSIFIKNETDLFQADEFNKVLINLIKTYNSNIDSNSQHIEDLSVAECQELYEIITEIENWPTDDIENENDEFTRSKIEL